MGIADRNYMRNNHAPGVPREARPGWLAQLRFAFWLLWRKMLRRGRT